MPEPIDHKAEASQGKALDAEDHRLHALRLIDRAEEDRRYCLSCDAEENSLRLAAIHSNLAIAEELRLFATSHKQVAEGQERVAEEIASLRGELNEIGRQINYLTAKP